MDFELVEESDSLLTWREDGGCAADEPTAAMVSVDAGVGDGDTGGLACCVGEILP